MGFTVRDAIFRTPIFWGIFPLASFLGPMLLIIGPLMKTLTEEFGENVYVLIAVQDFLTCTLGVVTLSVLSDLSQPSKFGRKSILVLFSVVTALPLVLFSFFRNGWVYIISNTVCGIVASKGVPFAIVSAWITDWAPEEIKMTIISLTFGGMAFLIVAANLTSVLLMSFHVVSEEGLVPMAAVFRVGSVFLIGSFFPSDLPKLDFLNRNSDPPAMQTGETVDSIVTESHSRGQVGIESSESARGAVEGPQGRPLSAMRGSLEVPTARGSIDPSFGGLLEKSLPAPVLSAAASRGNSRLNSQQPSRRVSACKHQEEHGEKEKEKNAEEKEKEKERQSEETLLPHAHRHPGSSCVAVEAAYRLSQLEPADEQPEGEGGGGDDLGSQNENAVDASEDAGETEEGWNLWRDWRRIVDPEVIRRVFEDIHKAWAYLTQKHLLLLIITLLALVADNGVQENFLSWLTQNRKSLPDYSLNVLLLCAGVSAGITSTFLIPALSQKVAHHYILFLVLICDASRIYIAAFAERLPFLCIAMILGGVGMSVGPVTISLVAKSNTEGDAIEDEAERNQGAILGGFNGVKSLCGAVGPMILGVTLKEWRRFPAPWNFPGIGFVLVGLLVWIAAVLSLVLAFTVAGRNWRRGSSTNVRQPLLQGAEDVEKGKVERGAVGREEGGPVKIRINVTDLQANTSARTEDEQTEVLLNTPELEQDRTPTPAT